VAYAGALVVAGLLRAGALGWTFYDIARPTADALFEIYRNPQVAAASYLEMAAAVVLVPTLPAFALYLGRRSPGLAWAGSALGALAVVLSLVGYLLEAVAYQLAAGGNEPTLLALVPSSDLVLLFNLMAEAITMPAMFIYYPWLLLWGIAFARSEGRAARAAAFAFFGVILLAAATFVGFGARVPFVANAGIILQTLAEAAAFALAGVTLARFKVTG